jgi:hypothetical protein
VRKKEIVEVKKWEERKGEITFDSWSSLCKECQVSGSKGSSDFLFANCSMKVLMFFCVQCPIGIVVYF